MIDEVERESAPFPLEGEGPGMGVAAGPHLVLRSASRRAARNAPAAFGGSKPSPSGFFGEALRKRKMNFRRQAPIGRFVADFAHLASRLVIEVDGPFHDLPDRQAADAARTRWLNAEGYRVIRFPEKRVRDDLVAVVDQIVAATAPPPSPTLPPSRGKGAPRYDVR